MVEERKSRFVNWRTIVLWLFVPGALAGLVVGGYVIWGYTVHGSVDVRRLADRDHPLFASHDADGVVPDYMEAVNQVYFEGVTPQNNLASLLLKIHLRRWTNDREELLKWISTDDPALAVLDSPSAFPSRKGTLDEDQARTLDLMVQQIKVRDRFACPVIRLRPYGYEYSSLGSTASDITRWLTNRASQSVTAGDLDAAWEDLAAGLRIAQRLSEGPLVDDWQVANNIQLQCLRLLPLLLNAESLDAELLERMAQQYPDLIMLDNGYHRNDWHQRAMAAYFMDRKIQFRQVKLVDRKSNAEIGRLPQGFVDSYDAMDVVNELIAIRNHIVLTFEDPKIAEQVWLKELEKWKGQFSQDRNMLLSPRKTATSLAVMKMASWAGLLESPVLQNEDAPWPKIGQVMIAARQWEFRNGRLPVSMDELFADPSDSWPDNLSLQPHPDGVLLVLEQYYETGIPLLLRVHPAPVSTHEKGLLPGMKQ